ncbi:MAG TPA: siphovirus Gp157 family protein [Edaphobacter sp.]|uniref:siphovirus Gp157 family protein n=1 Tax=Edaphobacter sp. TaxID=1934404 RepID=UPI002CFCD0B6|nr:siphovirus Gp157 family protein [Edaphobacter sp.]HUZ95454.1 siphovirus Gp157 family protein [Edaphobacter sp.]
MASIAETSSLFEIDVELDGLLEEIEEQTAQGGEPSGELVARFQQFCAAHGEKVDRIGRFVRIMEAREQYCRSEAARLTDRARATAGKVERTKNMVLYYLMSRDLKAIEGREFTLRAQKNSQDSVRITNEAALPVAFRKIDLRIGGVLWETVLANLPGELGKMLESAVEESRPDTDTIKAAIQREEQVPGAELRRGWHLRIR